MRNWNLSTKIIASYSVLIAVMAGTIASGMYWQLYSSQRQAIRNRLLAIVSLAVPQIDSDYHGLVLQRSDRPIACNIHDGIDSTILIVKHRLKPSETHPEIKVIKEYGQLPLVECFAAQLNQVFMNILANAIDALEESNIGRSFEEIKTNSNYITTITQIGENK